MKFCDKVLKKLVSWLKNILKFIMDNQVPFSINLSALFIILFISLAEYTEKNCAISLSYLYIFNVF